MTRPDSSVYNPSVVRLLHCLMPNLAPPEPVCFRGVRNPSSMVKKDLAPDSFEHDGPKGIDMAYLQIYEGDVLREQLELTGEALTIGRATDNGIVLASPEVSGYHAVIQQENGAFVLNDLGSSNGVFVDGKRIKQHRLRFWEDIQLPGFVLKFRPRARLPGEKDGGLETPDVSEESAATAELDVSEIRDALERHEEKKRSKQKIQVYYLLAYMDQQRVKFPLTNASFSIGKANGCDVCTPGWFAPKVAANIKRHSDGFYVFPGRRGKAQVNGARVCNPTPLQDGDCLVVRGITFLVEKSEMQAPA